MLIRTKFAALIFFMAFPLTAHVFCRVVDNFGDIGVCWRLARQLQAEHGVAVSLWVDQLSSFQRLCPYVDPERAQQQIEGIEIRHWSADFHDWHTEDIPDLVIEAFACDLPEDYIRAMAQRSRKPVWINLEYLSAESWVEGCHALPSPHPALPLTKYFFFPGFSRATGGLLREADLLQRRDDFQADRQARNIFLAGLGVNVGRTPPASLVSLFCYPDAPVEWLFAVWAQSRQPVVCLVPEGVAAEPVRRFLQQAPHAGASATQGQLTVRVIPFLAQADYDRLLWSCDLNLVRGEDSMVRAQWAGRPFIWQIYPQQDDAHWPKLHAFLECYARDLPPQAADRLNAIWRLWNGAPDAKANWDEFQACLPRWSDHTRSWASRLLENGDLVANLLRFAAKVG